MLEKISPEETKKILGQMVEVAGTYLDDCLKTGDMDDIAWARGFYYFMKAVTEDKEEQK